MYDSTACLTVPPAPVTILIPTWDRTWEALGPNLPVSTAPTPLLATSWAAAIPAPLGLPALELGIASYPMVAVSTMTKYGHLPNRGETAALRSGPVEETATFMSVSPLPLSLLGAS